MCGIAGMVDYKQELEELRPIFSEMQRRLGRRGPDQNGMAVHSPAALIHTRLSVVDLEKGRQPMVLALGDETLTLVYNGELYNTEELRRELSGMGHHFDGHSDTEVLLHSYAEWGERCVTKFNGIFAFAVWESAAKRLFLARDRIGVKPLFYKKTKNGLIFASEIKALLAHPEVPAAIDQNSIVELMLIGPGRTPGYGVFCGIEEVCAATCGYYSANGLSLHRYWSMYDAKPIDSFDHTVEKVRWLVKDAIERQLVSDVPVGTFLSGGLDSSVISSIADRYFRERGQKLKTFSVSYRDNSKYFKASAFQPNSDEEFIGRMNDYLGAEHYDILLDTDELVDALDEAVEARDLPGMADVDASLLLFCRKIKDHVTVALSGECADEIGCTGCNHGRQGNGGIA